jgi:tRNA (guanine-N7-)-methyltransferase
MPAQQHPTHPPRAVRSFVLRAGRMGSGQQRALVDLAPRYVLPFTGQPFAADTVFGRKAPLIVEIGFGMGDSTAAVAEASPSIDFIGIEVHPPGVGSLLRRIEARQLRNLRIVQYDAVDVLQQMIEPESLAGAMVFFPDPWPKTRHHKRRLIQPPFISLLASRLAGGATLHCATDWEPYALQMLQVLAAEPALANTTDGFAPRPSYRPLTKFEARGARLGHATWDLVFRRR